MTNEMTNPNPPRTSARRRRRLRLLVSLLSVYATDHENARELARARVLDARIDRIVHGNRRVFVGGRSW